MFELRRENNFIIIDLDTDLPFDCEGTDKTTYHFSMEFEDVPTAELFYRYFNKIIEARKKKEKAKK